MGLYKGKVQNIFTGSYILPSADDKRKFNVSREKVRAKKKDRGKKRNKKKLSIKKNSIPRFGLVGLSHKKRRITRMAKYVDKYRKTQYMGQVCL
jgi:hypothetical protein